MTAPVHFKRVRVRKERRWPEGQMNVWTIDVRARRRSCDEVLDVLYSWAAGMSDRVGVRRCGDW